MALPLLQRRIAPLWASLSQGVIWAVWHAPSFLIGGTPHSTWAFLPFFLGVVALAVIFTAMFNAAQGSLLIVVLLHFQLNNPIWPDAEPWYALTFGIAALAVLVLKRRTMLSRHGAVTEILMPGEAHNRGGQKEQAGARSE